MATGETRIGNADYISSGAPTEDGTGAFDGECFGVTGNGTGAGGLLPQQCRLDHMRRQRRSQPFDNNGLNFVAGQNDDVYLAYDGLRASSI